MNFTNRGGAGLASLWRPLLVAVGAAAAATSIYWFVKSKDTTPGPARVQTTAGLKKNRVTVSLAESEKKHLKALETIEWLEAEKSDLTDQVVSLQGTVQNMGGLLYNTLQDCNDLMNGCERLREAFSILHAENQEINGILRGEELLKVSLAEAEEKHQKAMEMIEQLETERSDLSDYVVSLRGTVQNIGIMFVESQRECEKLKNECEQLHEAYNILKILYDEMEKTLKHNAETLTISLTESEHKHLKALETINRLEQRYF